MLSEMTPEDMDQWEAIDQVVPVGDEKICWTNAKGFARIVNLLIVLATAWGAKDLPQAKVNDFIPWKVPKKKKPREYVNPNAMAAAVRLAVNR